MNTRVREGRTALAITVLLIATLTVPVLLFGNASGFAQTGQSPSPTGTAAQIELLNPSTHSNVLSDKDSDPSAATDPTDTQYHFVAWARNIPANALAEFFIIQGDKNFLLGSSTLKGSDTFDVYAPIPDGLDDTSTDAAGVQSNGAIVRVVLYANNGANEVDRDEQAVVVNQKEPTSDTLMQKEKNPANAAETVEMTYPTLVGPMGFYTQQGQRPTGVVEATTSSGTDHVSVSYTTSPVGTEPAWTDCNSTDETRANSADGTRCALADGTRPEQVTGIAAVAMDQESDNPNGEQATSRKNAGDAHRVVGFEQQPATVFVTSHTSATGACSPIVTVTVQDGGGREVVNAQVDVHAQGPTDNVAFNTDNTDTDAAGDPDPNDPPENHTTEAGRDCSDLGFGGTQGDHEVGGGPDRKHIESTDNTDDNGEFTYEMYSEAAGGTTMLAWTDKDDDDRYCATERSGTGTITWGSGGPAAPNPEGPELQTCQGSASGSASTSGSTSSTTTSSSTSPSTTSPTGSASTTSPTSSASTTTPTSSASTTTPTGTGTTGSTTGGGATTTGTTGSVQQATVDVSLEASQPRKTFGKSFTLSGSVTSTNSACTDFVNVRILRDVVGGSDEFELFAQEQTDANGTFSVTSKAERSANYIAQVAENATCDDASSSPQPVLVRVKVSLNLSKNSVNPGTRVRFKITTAPCPATARDKVLLFRAIQGEFGKSGSARSNGSCRATIVRRVNRSAVFQARWPKQSPEFLAGKSRSKAVRVDG